MSTLPRPAAAAIPARPRVWPLVAGGALVLLMAAAGRSLDASRHVEIAQTWTAALGLLAPVVYVLVYVAATLIGVPGLPFTLLSPVLFGVGPAIAVMVVASAISAALAFLIARYLARDVLAHRLAGTAAFARLSALVTAHDWAVVPFLRIVPLAPFAVVNYGFGLTGIGFWRYFGWSVLAMAPMNVLLVAGAGVLVDAATRGGAAWPWLAAAGVAAAAVLVLVWRGRRALTGS
jgi:uncharacterized membrane protein YdjX (TVP38/TMEM64 family)